MSNNLSASRPRVLIFAYAGEPGRGSESAASWGVLRTVAEFADCVVLVTPEQMPAIERWQLEGTGPAMNVVQVPVPWVATYAKWHRVLVFVAYLAWLRRARRVGLKLHAQQPFDFVHHVSFSTYWLPTPAVDFGVPALWGPVGGAVTTPLALWPVLGLRGIFDELLDFVAVRLSALWPATRRTWYRASQRILQNDETLARLPKSLQEGSHVLNHVMFIDAPDVGQKARRSYVLYIGALQSRKGIPLAIRALAHTPDTVSMVVAGGGAERRGLERLAQRLSISDRVTFLGRVTREKVFELLAEAAAVVFPGLREEGGVALAEAMLSGAPVIVLAHGGARTVAESAVDPQRVALIPPGSVNETAQRFGRAMTAFADDPPTASEPNLDQASARRKLEEIYQEVMRGRRSR